MPSPVELQLPRSAEAPSVARRELDARLGERVGAERLRDVQLVASELVSNAVRHGEGEITMKLEVLAARVRIEVVDEGEPQTVRLREPGEHGGFGLRLVASLAAQWGVFEGTTHVWAELRL